MNQKILTWQEFDLAVDAIAQHFKYKKIKSVFGEPRGGLPLAVALSHKLKVPYSPIPNDHALWVDDIIDQEVTFNKAKGMYGYYATWIARKPSEEYFNVALIDGDWVVFPWEDVKNAKEDYVEYVISRK